MDKHAQGTQQDRLEGRKAMNTKGIEIIDSMLPPLSVIEVSNLTSLEEAQAFRSTQYFNPDIDDITSKKSDQKTPQFVTQNYVIYHFSLIGYIVKIILDTTDIRYYAAMSLVSQLATVLPAGKRFYRRAVVTQKRWPTRASTLVTLLTCMSILSSKALLQYFNGRHEVHSYIAFSTIRKVSYIPIIALWIYPFSLLARYI